MVHYSGLLVLSLLCAFIFVDAKLLTPKTSRTNQFARADASLAYLANFTALPVGNTTTPTLHYFQVLQYTITLNAGEFGKLDLAFPDANSDIQFTLFPLGQTSGINTNTNGESSDSYWLDYHCLDKPATYLLFLQSIYCVNFTADWRTDHSCDDDVLNSTQLTFTKFDVTPVQVGQSLTFEQSYSQENIFKIPVVMPTACSPLIIDITYEPTAVINRGWWYACESATSSCLEQSPGFIHFSQSLDGFRVQYYVPCASSGNYYYISVSSANVTLEVHNLGTNYSCPAGCVENYGLCNLENGTCECTNYQTTPDCSYPIVVSPATPIDITGTFSDDGIVFSYVTAKAGKYQLEVNVTNQGPSMMLVIRLQTAIRGSYYSYIVFFNAYNPAFDGYFIESLDVGDTKVYDNTVQLSANQSTFYIGIHDYNQNSPLPQLNFTATTVDTTVPSKHFSDVTSTNAIYSFVATTTYVVVNVEGNSSLELSMANVTTASLDFNDLFQYDFAFDNLNDVITQVSTPTVIGQLYWIGVQVRSSGPKTVAFNVTITELNSAPNCGGTCGLEKRNGFCSSNNTCVCRSRWTGAQCLVPNFGSNPVNVTLDTPTSFVLKGNQSAYVFLPPTPVGYDLEYQFAGNTTEILYLYVNNDIQSAPTTSEYSYQASGNVSTVYRPSDCYNPYATPVQRVIYFYCPTCYSDITFVVTATLIKTKNPYNEAISITFHNIADYDFIYYHFDLPANCSDSYSVTMYFANESDTQTLYEHEIGTTLPFDSCFGLNTGIRAVTYPNGSGALVSTFPIYSCALGIDVGFSKSNKGSPNFTIFIAPAPGCPKGCSNHGTCDTTSLTCICDYPAFGDDCSKTYMSCDPIRTNLTYCKSDALSVFYEQSEAKRYGDSGYDNNAQCRILRDDANIGVVLDQVVQDYAAVNVVLSPACLTEFTSYVCDFTFLPCNADLTGFIFPCELMTTFPARCTGGLIVGQLESLLEDYWSFYPFGAGCSAAPTNPPTSPPTPVPTPAPTSSSTSSRPTGSSTSTGSSTTTSTTTTTTPTPTTTPTSTTTPSPTTAPTSTTHTVNGAVVTSISTLLVVVVMFVSLLL